MALAAAVQTSRKVGTVGSDVPLIHKVEALAYEFWRYRPGLPRRLVLPPPVTALDEVEPISIRQPMGVRRMCSWW
jgi:hypothetical protein